MSLLTDRDIRKLLDKDIIISPFEEKSLTPVGYDFRVGTFVYSLDRHALLTPVSGNYELPPKNTVLILTKETLWVSGRIGGLFHSKVSLVSKGLSPIATTLDPGWFGPLLITFRNNTDRPISLQEGATFVTLVMFKVLTPTKTPHGRPRSRTDILRQLDTRKAELLTKILEVLDDHTAEDRVKAALDAANAPMVTKVIDSIRRGVSRSRAKSILRVAFAGGISFLLLLNIFWNQLSFLVGGGKYDPVTSGYILSLALVLIGLWTLLEMKG